MAASPMLPRREQVAGEFRLPFDDRPLHGLPLRRFRFAGGLRQPRRAVLCLPGLAASGRSFARLQPLARNYDVQMLTVPLELPLPGDPISTLADVAVHALRQLDRPVLLGTSFGSLVALQALQEPRIRRPRALVLTAALCGGRMIPRRYAAFALAMLAPRPLAWLVTPFAAELAGGTGLDAGALEELVREARLVSGTEMYRRVNALLSADYSALLPRLRLPVLMIHGARDHIIPRREARKMAALIPDCRYHEIQGAGHFPYLTHPREFLWLLEPFLEEVFARRNASNGNGHGNGKRTRH